MRIGRQRGMRGQVASAGGRGAGGIHRGMGEQATPAEAPRGQVGSAGGGGGRVWEGLAGSAGLTGSAEGCFGG